MERERQVGNRCDLAFSPLHDTLPPAIMKSYPHKYMAEAFYMAYFTMEWDRWARKAGEAAAPVTALAIS